MPEEFTKVQTTVEQHEPSLCALTFRAGTPTQPSTASLSYKVRTADGEFDDSFEAKIYETSDKRNSDGTWAERRASLALTLVMKAHLSPELPEMQALAQATGQSFANGLTVRELGLLMVELHKAEQAAEKAQREAAEQAAADQAAQNQAAIDAQNAGGEP